MIARMSRPCCTVDLGCTVDLDAPVSLLPLRLAGDLGYAEDGEVTGDCSVDGPFRIDLQLDELTR